MSILRKVSNREKSRKYEINSMYYNHSINIDTLEALRDIKSATELLHIYKRSLISNQKNNKGA